MENAVCSFKKIRLCKIIPIYCLVVVLIGILSSCSSNPRYDTKKEYIEPDDPAGKSCISILKTYGIRSCKEKAEAEYRNCMNLAKQNAQPLYENALVKYQQDLAEAKKGQQKQSGERQEDYVRQQKEYNKCQYDLKNAYAEYQLKHDEWRSDYAGHRDAYLWEPQKPPWDCKLEKPKNTNVKYEALTQNLQILAVRKPRFNDNINTAPCYAIKRRCAQSYDQKFVECGGIVNQVTRCVENCPN